jgi:hypothetical protein
LNAEMADEEEEAPNPVFDKEAKGSTGPTETEAMLRELQVSYAAMGLKMWELETVLREQQGVVEATPVDGGEGDGAAIASENDGLLVYASNDDTSTATGNEHSLGARPRTFTRAG